MSLLTTQSLSIGYRDAPQAVAQDLNLSLNAGEFVCLIGPNGAGKSTLMRSFAGLQPPLAGQICLLGRALRDYSARDLAQHLSLVLTEQVNTGLLSGYDLVALGRHPYTGWGGRLSPQDIDVVRWAIDAVGATALAERAVSSLSDGERQKILIARALAQEPDLMLLDEPGAFLDLPRRVEIMGLLRDLAHESGRAVLASTHDLDLALRSADRIWLMPGDGSLMSGAPEDLVLNGAFAAAFDSNTIHFEAQTGSFVVPQRAFGSVTLYGSGLRATWTRRALERAGFSIADLESTALAQVEVCAEGWQVIQDGQVTICQTLQAVLDFLAPLKQPE